MRTDQLIQALAADRQVRSPSVGRGFALAIAVGFALSAAAFWVTLGPREDIAAALLTVRFDLKIVQTLLLAVTAAVLVVRLAQPGVASRPHAALLLAAPALLLVSVIAELVLLPAGQWQAALVGSNSIICLVAIPLLSVPMLAALLLALRHGAPTRPRLAGATAGLVAGGVAAALYAVQCTDDSPLFVAVWYSLAIGAISAVGAAAGARLLRW